jgi:hypothetical protein
MTEGRMTKRKTKGRTLSAASFIRALIHSGEHRVDDVIISQNANPYFNIIGIKFCHEF